MSDLPSGTVTFLFTDIEGSTRLLQELGDGYAEALAEHRRLLREAFERHGGVEVDTQGDAFFVAFARARDALAAAEEAQRALVGEPLRVRMGVHTGEPLVTDEGYVGLDVHRAARICSAGHGGQVLVSDTTASLFDGAGLRDLGENRLKDLSAPQRLYQLGHTDFPPLKALNQTNLPLQPTSFIGRERELTEVVELLRSSRLVTLTGPGGSGKTRLALHAAAELADEFEDGVWFVPLAAVDDGELIGAAIAKATGARSELESHLQGKRALLMLDNFEHLLDDAPIVAGLLAAARDIRVLATSRARLGLAAEREYAVPTLATEDAASLFRARAEARSASFDADTAVTEICERLDGLPLKEFAAERLQESGERAEFRSRHAEWALRLAEEVEPYLEGRAEQAMWLDKLEPERDNLRTASATLRELGRATDALRLATALWRLWYMRGPISEGKHLVTAALGSNTPHGSLDEVRGVRVLVAFHHAAGEWQEAAAQAEQALELSRRAGDEREEALAVLLLAAAAFAQGRLELAKERAKASARLAENLSDLRTAAAATSMLGVLALHDRDYLGAKALFEDSIAALGGEEFGTVVNLGNLALAAFRQGDLAEEIGRAHV